MTKHYSFRLLLFGFILVVFASCSRKMTNTGKDLVIYPAPPDTTRIQYLTSISNAEAVTGKRSAFKRFILGDADPIPIQKPYGVAVQGGKIYICDASIDGIEIVDLQKHTFVPFVPKGKGKLQQPNNCFVDARSWLYVADVERHQIVIFDSLGNYVNAIGDPATLKPTDVNVYEDKIFVSNAKENKINIYNKSTLELMSSFPESTKGSPDFIYNPTNLYVTKDYVYVSDIGDFNVKLYSHDGAFVRSVGSYGTNMGQFVRPKGIAVDRDGNLFVVDAGFENTQVFDKDGKLLMFFGGAYKGPGDMWLPAKVTVDYDHLKYFESYVDKSFRLKYLIFVTSQYGPDKLNIYGAVESKK